MTSFVPLSAVFAVGGLVLGVLADRLATRWPEHEPPEFPAGRSVGWRTPVCAGFGGVAVAGLATDLDQRLLPDVLTLPVIPVAAIYAVSGLNPLVGADLLPAVIVATVVPAVIYLASLPFGAGAFGLGDVKLLVGVGLMAGGIRAFTGIVSGLFFAGVVLVVLVVTRRITLRTYVPYGPFLIFGAVWGLFVRAEGSCPVAAL